MILLKSKRRKELETKEEELHRLRLEIQELKHWCAADSGEIAFAMLHLEKPKLSVWQFRKALREGKYTFAEYKKTLQEQAA